ncbi:MAG: phosphotransacetylase family protein [Theionarchaea archaeon]|nr:phosphotransacetylase family protein [Theionarchaea archaeon]MBU7001462.1 phosphotransacetylase family protein [Theionarchaea archaeon]MBU7022230.1 phosphotransacetylase family protein [Theionarchaea archaeon]MBU7035112.1 phosphotransacetylase family protein [Theionarchaea archaeon]MBU7040246.1 phosphotransacetylase family protein [Theionarchaea archaeon]
MKTLFITSTSSYAGKSTVGLCAALNFPGKVSYFKPLTTDADCRLFKKVLNLEQEESELSLGDGDFRSRFSALSENTDLMIVESGPNLSYGAYKGLSPSEIARALEVEPVIITAGSIETIVDKLVMGKGCFSSIKGVIINKVGYSDLNEMTSFVIPSLEKVGFPVLGHIPSYKVLRMITSRDVQEHLNAEVICEEGMDKGIDTVLVGAMTFDAALTYFRRFADKVVVTGGDRAEIMLAAMETSTSCIVATGGVRPSPPVIKKAVELKIPILLVKGHTYAAAKEIEEIRPELRPDDHQKIELIRKMIARQIDLKTLLE